MIQVRVAESSRGLVFSLAPSRSEGRGRRRYPLEWPAGIWKKLPARFREVLADNLAHLLTLDTPLVAHAEGVRLNRPRPCFWSEYRTAALGGIPAAVESYPRERTSATLARFRALRYEFDRDLPRMPSARVWPTRPRVVVLFSSGKDSLATLGLAREMGLDPVAVYVDDTVSPGENRLKRERVARLRAMGFPAQIVTNRVEQLNDFARWDGRETCLGYLHMVTSFALIALPVARAFRARYIALGNEQDLSFTFTNKDGFLTYPSFDQTSGWTMQLDLMTRTLTGGAVRTMSLIEPLTGFAVMKTLVERYPELAALEASCDALDSCDEPRWCADCSKCATVWIYLLALGVDPASVGLKRGFASARDARFFALFGPSTSRRAASLSSGGADTDHYERTTESKEQQELAFHLAVERGLAGPLARRFTSRFPDGIRRDELLAKYLALRPPSTVPPELRDGLMRILRDAMKQGGFPLARARNDTYNGR